MRVFPGKLSHEIPPWVEHGARFHIRLRCAADNQTALSHPTVAPALIKSALFFYKQLRWHPFLFLLMPDHLHALLSFPPGEEMRKVIGDWKRFQTRKLGINWQDNFFDHRLRQEESFDEKAAYIRNNPVVKKLCSREDEWPWVLSVNEQGNVTTH